MMGGAITQRDYDRYGINILKAEINVKVFVCKFINRTINDRAIKNDWIECDDLREFDSIKEIIAQIAANRCNTLIVDCLSDDLKSRRIRMELKYLNIPRMILHLGILPQPDRKMLPKIKRIFLYLLFHPLSFGKLFINSLVNKVLPSPTADIVLCGGSESLISSGLQAVPVKIIAHAFDYDYYRIHQAYNAQNNESYAVFLDEDMVYHSDYSSLLSRPPATEKNYYPSLAKFFNEFERITGLEIIIAIHPRSSDNIYRKYLGNRRYVKNGTPELVRDAKIVLCHCSTSINFAILWKKPIVFLTTKELQQSFAEEYITLVSKLLKSQLINIDENYVSNVFLDQYDIDHNAYALYKERFIKINGTPNKSIWSIFLDHIKASSSI